MSAGRRAAKPPWNPYAEWDELLEVCDHDPAFLGIGIYQAITSSI